MLPVTSATAALLTLLYLFLAVLVIRRRWRHRVPLLDAGVTELARAVRAHGNFAEYAPLFLILLGLSELRHEIVWLGSIAAAFILGRLLHPLSLLWHETRWSGYPFVRSAGMILTFGPMMALAVGLLA